MISSPEKKDLAPSLFIAHGNPNILITPGKYREFLSNFHTLIKKPDAIIIFTAHWESNTQLISSVKQYETIYDFTGFPREMYEMSYPAPGHPELAKEILNVLKENGIESALDETRGIDHGAWAILKIMYPDADIPVVQMSVSVEATPEEAFKIGKSLQAFRERNIAIIGSGNTVHNVADVRIPLLEGENPDWATEFDDWMGKYISEWNTEELFEYKKAPWAWKAAPTTDHFIPLYYALGAGDNTRKPSILHRSNGTPDLTYFSWKFE